MGITLALYAACMAVGEYVYEGFNTDFFVHVGCSVIGLVSYGIGGHQGTRFGRVLFATGGGVLGVLAAMVSDPFAGAAAAVCILGSLFTPDAK